jgi:anti-sigma B factor antagonist
MEFAKKQIRKGVAVLGLTGSIRIGPNCQQIELALDEMIQQGNTCLVLDLANVTYIDSAGIGTLVRGLTKYKKAGGTLRLAGVKGMVGGVLKLTQIDRAFQIFPTAEEAAQDLPLTPKT